MAHQTVLITGASSGIGLELAKVFAREKYNLVLVARNQDTLQEIADDLMRHYSVDAIVIPADLAKPEAPEEIFTTLQKKDIRIDILVNNAGFTNYGSFPTLDTTQEINLVKVNIEAVLHLTRLALPDMLERKSGKILNVASTASFLPGPLMANYYASKAYVRSLSEATHQELKGFGITVSCLCPGPTATNFGKVEDAQNSLLFRMSTMKATKVAEAGFRGLMKGKRVILPGFSNKLIPFYTRLIPTSMALKVVAWLQGKKS